MIFYLADLLRNGAKHPGQWDDLRLELKKMTHEELAEELLVAHIEEPEAYEWLLAWAKKNKGVKSFTVEKIGEDDYRLSMGLSLITRLKLKFKSLLS